MSFLLKKSFRYSWRLNLLSLGTESFLFVGVLIPKRHEQRDNTQVHPSRIEKFKASPTNRLLPSSSMDVDGSLLTDRTCRVEEESARLYRSRDLEIHDVLILP
jgi:hypothetical protein